MKSFSLNRRALLRGAGGVSIALPLLDIMARPRRARAAAPKRLVIFFTPCGIANDFYYQRQAVTGSDYPLPSSLAPLAPWRKRLVVVQGLYQGKSPIEKLSGPGDDHMQGMAWSLTGRQLLPGDIPAGGSGIPPAGLASGISVDQAIANQIGTATRFKSLEFGVRSLTAAGNPLYHMVYTGPGSALQPQQDPARMFDRIFNGFSGGKPAPDPVVLRRTEDKKSVVDAVKDSYSWLSGRVGTADRLKLGQHLENIRDLERRLLIDPPAMPAAGCSLPATPAANDAASEANFSKNGDAQMDLLTMALACDMTRVASLQWSWAAGGPTFTWLGQNKTHHDVSHDNTETGLAAHGDVHRWYSDRFVSLLTRMDAIREDNGSLLDNSLVVWMNELGHGAGHSHENMGYVLAGTAGGALTTGRWVRTVDRHNNLLVSLMNLMDVPATTFGDPTACTGKLAAL